jgi:RNA polymerase sigma factor (sigma-70 family)
VPDEIPPAARPDEEGQVRFRPGGQEIDAPMSTSKKTRSGRRPYMVAVVLGTALAAIGSTEKLAAAEVSDKAVGGISRYCSACWRNARLPIDRWGDCTQEVFTRLLERVPMSAWEKLLTGEGEERRELLRAIDTVKKRHQRERARNKGLLEPIADDRDQRDRSEQEQREALQLAADEVLSTRQQRILQLICDGHTVGDIASELSIPAERVSDEKYKAIQKLRTYFDLASQPA